ncbi:MAG: hypothetical protein H6721_21280 [Sandaracinus sp.]|nr:hypothetical protein [Sandaracinus sp.]
MDPRSWRTVFDGTLVAVEREGADARLRFEIPHLRPPFDVIDVHLGGVERLFYLRDTERWDEPEVHDPAALVAAALRVVEPRRARNGDVVIDTPEGWLRLRYHSFFVAHEGRRSDESFEEAVRDHWARFRAGFDENVHPAVAAAFRGHAASQSLLETWRDERTSDLADTLAILSEGPDEAPTRLTSAAAIDAWIATWREHPSAALDELGRAADATFDVGDDGPYEAREAARQSWWEGISRALAAVDAAPDPRVGRGVERTVAGPSDHWFRVDQVRHVVASFEATSEAPSFADHLLRLLEHHADGGTVARLEKLASVVSIEADCNGAEMASRLRALAAELRGRYPADRTVSAAARMALRFLDPA